MRMVLHRAPAVLRVPGTHQWESVHRGKEFADDHPFCTAPELAWLFEETPEPAEVTSVNVGQDAPAAPATRGRRGKATQE